MRWILALVLLLTPCLSTFAADEKPPTDKPASQEPPFEKLEAPTTADFVGKWAGKWDSTWPVEFTVTFDEKEKTLSAIYRWKEKVDGEFHEMKMACTIEKDRLMVGRNFIEISRATDDANLAYSYGHFRKPRAAMLDKVVEPAKKE